MRFQDYFVREVQLFICTFQSKFTFAVLGIFQLHFIADECIWRDVVNQLLHVFQRCNI